MATTEYVSPVPISDAIFRYIGQEIIQGRIAPGERLLETKLCEQFGCSRSPVREAVRMLAAENLVTIEPRRGARVTQMDGKEIDDLFEVRLELEGLAVRQATLRASDAQLGDLTRLHEEMESAVSIDDSSTYFAKNTEFHHQIALISGNDYLAALQKSTIDRSFQTLFRSYTARRNLNISIEMHGLILGAMRAKDADAAEAHMRAHIKAAQDEAVKLLNQKAFRGIESGPTEHHKRSNGGVHED